MTSTIVLPDTLVPAPTSLGEDFAKFQPIPLLQQLEMQWPTDAHTTMYSVPGATTWPRHKKDTLSFYPAGQGPELAVVLVDLDFPDHSATWDSPEAITWFEDIVDTILALDCGFYSTRGGLRLVWPLLDPIPVGQADAWLAAFLEYLAPQLPVDMACKDWTRLFRLPRATRDGVLQEPLFEDYSAMAPLDWQPDTQVDTPEREPVLVEEMSLPLPEIPFRRPTVAELAQIEDAIGPTVHYNLLHNMPFAEPGSRHKETRRVVLQILNTLKSEDPYAPWRMLAHSYHEMVVRYPDSSMEKLWRTCLELAARKKAEQERVDELQRQMADLLDIPEEVAMHSLIVGVTNLAQYYVWDTHKAVYTGPHTDKWMPTILERQCGDLGISTYKVKGGRKTLAQLLDDYGSPIEGVVYDLSLDRKSRIIGSRLHLRGFEHRGIKPRWHADVATWLEKLGGDNVEQLLDWVATFPQLGSPTCALFLQGPPGSGKSLLAKGLVQLWADEPISYEAATQRFNKSLVEIPLILIDEAKKGLKDGTTFRNLVGGVGLSTEVKFGGQHPLLGFPRLCITANNTKFMETSDYLTPDDIGAIIERIGHLEVTKDATEYLDSIGGFGYINSRWVDGHWIAEHCLWLAEHRKVERKGRWLVEGWETRLTKQMPTSVEAANELCAMLAKCVVRGRTPRGLLVGDGGFWLAFSELPMMWAQEIPGVHPPSNREFRDVLHSLTTAQSSVQKRVAGRNRSLWKVEPRYVAEVAEDCGICTGEEIFLAVGEKIP